MAVVGMVVALSRAFVIEGGTAFDPEAALMGERACVRRGRAGAAPENQRPATRPRCGPFRMPPDPAAAPPAHAEVVVHTHYLPRHWRGRCTLSCPLLARPSCLARAAPVRRPCANTALW